MKLKAVTLFFVCLVLFFSCEKNEDKEFKKLGGYAFGTNFQITYQDDRDFTKEIDSLFQVVNKSLSTYLPDSDISKINNGDTTIVVDALFAEVYAKSLKVYKETEGIFDPTIGILVNAWGFGPEKAISKPDSARIRELLLLVGFDKVHLRDGRIKKDNDSIYFDFNAIAKGYAVDVAGRFLEAENVANYLVEIGGEIRTRGVKKNGSAWKAGIEDPNFDGTRSIQKIVELKDEAMATSGSYRKFKVDSLTGQKYVHILDAKTGYSTQSSLLSVSVIGKTDCADVDGYATALMAMPLEKAKQFLKNHQELRAYLIFSDPKGNLQSYATENF
ncbi:MAG: FAD:protein FMN transferase [Flavobacteriaceae bacterium]|nr:FAD:protein FMN transferase [Flavobacteriaceae bacterium]